MNSVLMVCLHRPNRSPCQRFRFEQYINFLNQNNFQCTLSFILNEKDDKIFYTNGKYFSKFLILSKSIFKRIREVYFTKRYDIVFVQRECFMLGTSFFEKKFSKKSKIIFDFDDSIWMQNISNANKALSFLKNSDKTTEIIKIADLVIAGNQYLANYALKYNKNTFIIPTTIDTDLYTVKQIVAKDKITIGWSGSFSTVAHFLSAIDALYKIKDKYGNKVVFVVIGDANYKNERLKIVGKPWIFETEIAHLHQIDIGIMPLIDDEWCNGKCGLKGLQYMAIGLPTIMSAVGVNTSIIQDGENGFLASTTQEWFDKLSMLIDSLSLRQKFGILARKTVEDKYSIKANQQLYLNTLNTVLQN